MSKRNSDSGMLPGYMLTTDRGIVLYSAACRRGAGKRLHVVSDPTGDVPVRDDGTVVGWTLNAFITGVPLSANDGNGRVDLSHLGKVVAIIAFDVPDGTDVTMHDFWAAGNAAADRIVVSPLAYGYDDLMARRAALGAPRPFPRNVRLLD